MEQYWGMRNQKTQTNWFPRIARRLRPLLGGILVACVASSAEARNEVEIQWNPNPEPDIESYTLYFGTVSGGYSAIHEVTEPGVILVNLEPGRVYYCAVQARNTSGLVSPLSNEVSFSTRSARAVYDDWASDGGLSGADAEPGATPDGSGVSNLLKYAFPADGSGEGMPVFWLDRASGNSVFKVSYLRRKYSGLRYVPMISTDLETRELMVGATDVSVIDDDWEWVIVERAVDLAATPRLFGTVEVVLP